MANASETKKGKVTSKAVAAEAAKKTEVVLKVAPGAGYGTGRRKTSVARVWAMPGSGRLQVNGRLFTDYFHNRPAYLQDVAAVLKASGTGKQWDVKATVAGGGLSGQLGAFRLGLARAIVGLDTEAEGLTIRAEGFLTRDAREKERKKYGRKRARKGFQYRKR